MIIRRSKWRRLNRWSAKVMPTIVAHREFLHQNPQAHEASGGYPRHMDGGTCGLTGSEYGKPSSPKSCCTRSIVNTVWTDGEKILPIDYRIYDPTHDGKTKNDHAREMLGMAKKRGLKPQYVLMDAWFTSIGNLKAIDAYDW